MEPGDSHEFSPSAGLGWLSRHHVRVSASNVSSTRDAQIDLRSSQEYPVYPEC
jgi:hypothetical protein